MAGVIENDSKFEVSGVVRGGASQSCIHRRSVRVYGQNGLSRKEVSVRCNKFKDGRTALNDDPEKHRGRPRTSHNDENCAIVEGLIRRDRGIKFVKLLNYNNSHPLQTNTTMWECLNL
jgi:hypothetical protein